MSDTVQGIIFIVIAVFVLRAFGAWMLRIDEVIKLQQQILDEIKKNNGSISS